MIIDVLRIYPGHNKALNNFFRPLVWRILLSSHRIVSLFGKNKTVVIFLYEKIGFRNIFHPFPVLVCLFNDCS